MPHILHFGPAHWGYCFSAAADMLQLKLQCLQTHTTYNWCLFVRGLTRFVVQVRICTRMGVEMKSTDFRSKDYYSNIRKAVTAGYFMQVCQFPARRLAAFAGCVMTCNLVLCDICAIPKDICWWGMYW